MRGIGCRSLRLELVAGVGIALALPALAQAAMSTPGVATQTTLAAETRDQAGSTQASFTVTVAGQDGRPASGAVSIFEDDRQLANAALDVQGQAKIALDLPGGDHQIRAEYAGDGVHAASVSLPERVRAMNAGVPDFQISVSPVTPATFPLTLTAGEAGTILITVTPVNNASLGSIPMFVEVSCSGLPDQASCLPAPGTLSISSSTPTSCPAGSKASACPPTATMVMQTYAASTASATPAGRQGSSPIAWALLLPGVLGLGGLAWGARRRRWLSRVSLVALVAFVTLIGTTACNPRYNYLHHGPPTNLPTPSGTYTIKVAGQSNNGVTAITHATTFVMTVK